MLGGFKILQGSLPFLHIKKYIPVFFYHRIFGETPQYSLKNIHPVYLIVNDRSKILKQRRINKKD